MQTKVKQKIKQEDEDMVNPEKLIDIADEARGELFKER